ncbi:MAG: hypothetical protein M3Y23_02105, partial [Actinomycetota bacterium]|nr:hypothetical protein [Actinomycetota bacterium]
SARPGAWYKARTMSDDGRWVYFSTAEPFDPRDVNGLSDAYLWDSTTGDITMISGGRSLEGVSASAMTADASTLTFTTDQQLIPEHTSTGLTAYAARVNGGFLSPEPAAPRCEGDACQGDLVTPPAFPLVGSLGSPALGNVNPSPEVDKEVDEAAKDMVSVSKPKTARGAATKVVVKVSGKGRIRVSGSGLRRASKTTTKAGSYRVAVKLSKRARRTLRRKHRVKVRITVRFTPQRGQTTTKRVSATFKRSTKATKKGSSTASRKAKR